MDKIIFIIELMIHKKIDDLTFFKQNNTKKLFVNSNRKYNKPEVHQI